MSEPSTVVPRLEQERDELLRERDELRRSLTARESELASLVYSVTHDLKSPLFTILGFLSLLEKDVARGDRERMDEDIRRIRRAGEQMHRLLDQLLARSRDSSSRDANGSARQSPPAGTAMATEKDSSKSPARST